MKPRRKFPRINVRFSSHLEMDDIELRANRDGLDLQNWLRRLVREEMVFRQFKQRLIRESLKSLLIIRYVLEQLVDDDKVKSAREKAERKIEHLDLQSKQL